MDGELLYGSGENSIGEWNITDGTGKLTIGLSGESNSDYFHGYIDDFRISKNEALWTENFTPPARITPSVFTVELSEVNTIDLSGKYIQQLIITDSSGNIFKPGQGNIIILPAPEV